MKIIILILLSLVISNIVYSKPYEYVKLSKEQFQEYDKKRGTEERIENHIIQSRGYQLSIQRYETFSLLLIVKNNEFEIMLEAFSKTLDENNLEEDQIQEIREKDLKQAWMDRVEAYLIVYPQYIDEKELGNVLLIKFINGTL